MIASNRRPAAVPQRVFAVKEMKAQVGDPIRPFAHRLWNDIRLLLKPGVRLPALPKVMATYLHLRSYQIARSGLVFDRQNTGKGENDEERSDGGQRWRQLIKSPAVSCWR